ncbi:hypothetical protein H0V99_00425 [Candidatus Saccharibacteria bacterium]|nr:hypothetical protein [Candidatus Saccharibacteria bacterium]
MDEMQEQYEKPKRKALDSRIVRSFVVGVALTLLSLVMIGFNLSTAGGIKINDDVNRYFDTCVGEGFVDNTPRIRTDERGFPLAYVQTSHVPVCENTGVELKRSSTRSVDLGALGANVLFWTCSAFIILRRYGKRKPSEA